METIKEAANRMFPDCNNESDQRTIEMFRDIFRRGVEFAQQWISVEDELPDFDIDVIWKMDSGHYFVSDIDHDCDFDTLKKIYESPLLDKFECQDKITHWRPVELK